MIRIFIKDTEEGKICLNVDNDDDAATLLSKGARELTKDEIKSNGMAGFEANVSPSNTIVRDDGSVQFTPPVTRPEELTSRYTAAIQKALDAFARTRGYDNIVAVCSYATSTKEPFAKEAAYCVRLRDDTWSAAYPIMDAIAAGTREPLTVKELLAALPVGSAKWPEA